MMDIRAQSAGITTTHKGFGSVTSIQQIHQADNLVVVKGSFGPCLIFDIRLMSGGQGSRNDRPALMELSIPDSMLHQTKSVRCTGLAIDPTRTLVVSPFADRSGQVQFAMWSLESGTLLRTLGMNGAKKRLGLEAVTTERPPAFCELSSVVTAGQDMVCKRGSDEPTISHTDWGLWFKTDALSGLSTPDSGGIHHIRF